MLTEEDVRLQLNAYINQLLPDNEHLIPTKKGCLEKLCSMSTLKWMLKLLDVNCEYAISCRKRYLDILLFQSAQDACEELVTQEQFNETVKQHKQTIQSKFSDFFVLNVKNKLKKQQRPESIIELAKKFKKQKNEDHQKFIANVQRANSFLPPVQEQTKKPGKKDKKRKAALMEKKELVSP